MFKVYLTAKKIVVFDRSEKEFKAIYGNSFEQISVIKDQDNIDSVCEKLLKQYKAEEVVKDCKIKKKFGWKYWPKELQEVIRTNMSIAMKRYKKTKEHGESISRGKKLKPAATFKGKKHSEHTKKKIAHAKRGVDPIKGKKWMHDPLTGKELRAYELQENMIWGRSPEAREYIYAALEQKRRAKMMKQARSMEETKY
jgi:hypothetical protein